MLDGIILVYDNTLRGKGRPNSKLNRKIPNRLRLNLINDIDTNHSKRNKAAFRRILNWLQKKHAIYCINNTFL